MACRWEDVPDTCKVSALSSETVESALPLCICESNCCGFCIFVCWNLLSSRASRGKAVLLVQQFFVMHATRPPTPNKSEGARDERILPLEATQARLHLLNTQAAHHPAAILLRFVPQSSFHKTTQPSLGFKLFSPRDLLSRTPWLFL